MKAKTTFSISILILACGSIFYNRCEAQQGWNIQDILEPSYKFTSIFFVDANSGYIGEIPELYTKLSITEQP